MDRWKKELLDFAYHLLFVMTIGGIFIYLIVSIIIGGDIMKNLLVPISLLTGLAALKFWRFRIRERKEIDKYFRNLDRCHNPSLKKLYRIKKAVDESEIEILLKKNDICIVESRDLDGDFETLIFFKDSRDFSIVISRLSWDIRDPLKMILDSGDMSYKKTAQRLTDILVNTVVTN